jgi:hypothetical protein
MSNQIITEQELKFFRKKAQMYMKFWQWNPVAFVYMLGMARILPYQADILQSIVDNKRTIVRSGHGSGKTFVMALAAIWWLCTHWLKGEGCSVIVTSPSSSNLTTVFLAQLSKCLDLLPKYYRDHFEITSEAVYQNEDTRGWRLDLRTARKDNPDAMAGQHNVLFLIDEWSGVPIEIYRVIEGAMSDEGSRILGIGNPIRRSGWGYEAFTKNKKLWKLFHINCGEYTHDKEYTTVWYDILGNEQIDVNNGRVDPKEVQKWLDISGGNTDGYDFRIRVAGEFPMAGKNQFISLKLIEPCFKTDFHEGQSKAHTLGLDPATSGGDDIALVHRWGSNLMSVKTWQQEDTRKIAYEVRDWLNSEGKQYKFKFIAVDAIGDGKGVYDSLREMHESGDLKNLEVVFQYKSSYEANNKERFDRLRDESWSKMRDWFINEKPHFSRQYTNQCEELREELVGLTSDFTTHGKLKLESKKDLRKRGIKSPNIADALGMTFSRHDDIAQPQTMDRYRERLEKWRTQQTAPTDWRCI